MKFTPAISTRWANAPNGAKIAPTVSGGTSRPMRTKRNKKNSSSLKKMLDKSPGLCYYNTREREKPSERKGNKKMTSEYFEIHAVEWEAAQAYWAEVDDLAQMDADWEASDGHLWD